MVEVKYKPFTIAEKRYQPKLIYRSQPSLSIPPKKIRHQPHKPHRRPRPVRHRRLYCDCGEPAITVLIVKVGSDPQYTVRLPLCQACLMIEQGFNE